MHTPLKYFSAQQSTNPSPYPLSVNGKEITSLQMLRSETKPEELYPLLQDHSLLHWLIAQGQELTAYTLAQLLRTTSFTTQFRSILDYPSEHEQELSQEELHACSARKNYISTYTNDDAILSNPYSVALNQGELNEILFLGTKKIYLCEDAFKIPIVITDVHYVGIGGAVVKPPLSQEEYRNNNIIVDGIPLPEHPAKYISPGIKSSDATSRFDAFLPKEETLEILLPPFLAKKTETQNPNS